MTLNDFFLHLRARLRESQQESPADCNLYSADEDEPQGYISFYLIDGAVHGAIAPRDPPGTFEVRMSRAWGDGASQVVAGERAVDEVLELCEGFLNYKLPPGAKWDEPWIRFKISNVTIEQHGLRVAGLVDRGALRPGDAFTLIYSHPPEAPGNPLFTKRSINAVVREIRSGNAVVNVLTTDATGELVLSGITGGPIIPGDTLVGLGREVDSDRSA